MQEKIAALLEHLQREDLTREDRLESLRIAMAGAWEQGHTAAMEDGFDLPNPYNY